MRLHPDRARRRLLALLRAAYSGELAASLAYRGHARSVAGDVRAAIERIEAEEWAHRAQVGAWLRALGAGPAAWREILFGTVGRALGALCGPCGWTLPMLGAWLLEKANVAQYARGAALAREAGRPDLARELDAMSALEATHVRFFRAAAAAPWSPSAPRPPREGADIRA